MLKGVAILMMLFLHLFNNPELNSICEPWIYIGDHPLVNILSRASNPVDIFLMLSGYGLSYSYSHKKLSIGRQTKRLLQLYIHYWIILLIFVGIGCFVRPDRYPGNLSAIVLNFTSISSSYNSETWFLFPYMLLSFTALWVFKAVDRMGNVLSLIVSGLLYVAGCYIVSRYIASAKAYSTWYNYLLTYINFLFPFIIGAVFHRLVEKGKVNMSVLKRYPSLVPFLLVGAVVMHCLLSNAVVGPFFQIIYILLLLHIRIPAFINKGLLSLGKHSMVMWLTHSFFCYHLFHDFIYGFRYPLLIYVVLLVISYAVSFPIMFFAKQVIGRVSYLRV